MTIAELKARGIELAKKIRGLHEQDTEKKKSGDTSYRDAWQKEWDATNAEYDSVKAQLDEAQREADLQARMARINDDEKRAQQNGKPKPGLDDYIPGEDHTYGDAGHTRDTARQFAQRELDRRNALRAFIASQSPESRSLISDEIMASCQRLGFSPQSQGLSIRLFDTETHNRMRALLRNNLRGDHTEEIRAMAKGTSGAGAELVPTTFLTTLETAMVATSPFLQYVDSITTDTGEPMQWPTVDDTAQSATIIAEAGSQDTDPTDATLSTFTLNAYDYTTAFIKVSMQLTRDSLANVDQLLAKMIGERISRKLNTDATVGDGSSKMTGIVTSSTNGKTAAATNAITILELIDLQHSVDPAYRTNAMFMAHDTVISILRKLVDSNGRPYWASGLADGRPDTLLGQPIIYNQAMASSLTASAKSVLYGDFSYYKFRRVGSVNLFKAQERFIDKMQLGFLGYLAADGKLLTWTGAKPVKRITQAAS